MSSNIIHEHLVESECDLIENGSAVVLSYRGMPVQAKRDTGSGYVHFLPPSIEELADYYQKEYGASNPDYYSVDHAYAGPANYVANVVEGVCKHIGAGKSIRIHEIGCSFGGAVSELNRRGHSVTGSDINGEAIRKGREEKDNSAIFASGNKDAILSLEKGVDIIYASHVLEHDPDCIEVVRECRDRLSDRGALLIMVPNSMYVRALLEGFSSHPWVAYPDHLHMFSIGSLGRLCDVTGFEPVFVSTCTSFEVDEASLQRHFGTAKDNRRVRSVWETLIAEFGLGMELRFVVVPKDSQIARERATEIALARSKISTFRVIEQRVRSAIEPEVT